MVLQFKKLKDNKDFIKYFKNTSWLFIEKIVRILIGFFVGVWLARYLGPEQFGIYAYVQSIVALFLPIASLGLDGIVIRELVKNQYEENLLLGTSFVLKFVGSLIVLCLLYLITSYWLTREDNLNMFIMIIASSSIIQSFNVIDYFFQSKVMSKYTVYANIISIIVSSCIKILFILMKAPLIYFIYVFVLDSLILALGYIYYYISFKEKLRNWKFDFHIAYSLLKESWPLLISSVVISIYMKIDQIMIKEFLNLKAVGEYAAAVRLSEALYFIPTIVVNSVFPAIVKAKETNQKEYYKKIQMLYNVVIRSSLVLIIPMVIISDWLIDIVFGEAYRAASNVFVIHIWTLLFISMLLVSGKWLINEGHTLSALYRNIAGIISNIVLNYIFIAYFGIVGAAWATLISYSIAGFIYDIFDKNLRYNFYLKYRAFLIIRGIKND